jgi:hypothetical protein
VTVRFTRTQLLFLLHEDQQLFEQLCEAELLPRDEQALEANHAELARIAGTLVHELEVNWPGVEVALRLHRELLETRRQLRELLLLLRTRRL